MSFVHLRVHSEYSFLRGACRLEALVRRANELGMPAVALTDYGVLHGAVRFTNLARRHGVQPILGAEFTLPGGLPLLLLAQNKRGWQNLLRVVNGYHLSVPRKEFPDINHLTGCAEGLFAVLHAGGAWGDPRIAENTLDLLMPSFGSALYLALEDAGQSRAKRANRWLAECAGRRGLELVATHNVHYVLEGDDAVYRLVNCIREGRPLAGAEQCFLPGKGYDLKGAAEMVRRFADYPEACENTLRLAKRCDFILEGAKMHLPGAPGWDNPDTLLRQLCADGLKLRGISGEEAENRLEKELAVISARGLCAYFLIVHDLVSYAQKAGIAVGPGRGSAGGSLVAYLLGITQVDPLAHRLYFERFLSADREGFPDIDLDVCQRRRDEILHYLRGRYGDKAVAQVSTFSTLGARAAVREAGKVLDLAAGKISKVAEALPHYAGQGGIEAAVSHFPELRLLRDEESRGVLSSARCLEGLCRHLSTHASGVIIGTGEMLTDIPLCRGPAGELLTQWDKDDVEAMGFLKIDILGSRNLTIIHDTLAYVRQRLGRAPGVEDIPLMDEKTFQSLRRGDTLGCFQLESGGMRRILRRLAPQRLEDLVHLLSLYRPGPWESGMVDLFIARRHGREANIPTHEVLDHLLEDTYGVVLYQEQVMRVACEVGGYTPGEADRLRREMSRRLPVLQEYHLTRFTAGAVDRGMPKEEAEALFEHLCRYAGYGFNKAHAAAYALVSYWTAYLKTHYPVEFYAALLSAGFGYYGPVVYVHEARRRGIDILGPHVNRSGVSFVPEGGAIRAALHLVRDLGGRGVWDVLAARQGGHFTSLRDFCRRVGRGALRRSALANLIKVGAFSGLGLNRRQALAVLDYTLKCTDRLPGQMSLLDLLPEENPAPALPEYSGAEAMAAEAQILGMSLCAHPLLAYEKILRKIPRSRLADLADLPADLEATVAAVVVARSRRRLKKGGVMLTLFLSDESGFGEAVFFPAVYRRLFTRLGENALLVRGKTAADGDVLVVEDAWPLSMVEVRAEA